MSGEPGSEEEEGLSREIKTISGLLKKYQGMVHLRLKSSDTGSILRGGGSSIILYR